MFGIDKMAPLLLRIKLPQIFVIFKNGWLLTAASEESEIAAFHIIRFLTGLRMLIIQNKNQGVKIVQHKIFQAHSFGAEKLKIKIIIVAKKMT